MSQLSKDVFKTGMQKLIDVFTAWRIEIDNPRVMATWYEFFQDWKDETFLQTVNNYIREESAPPTVKGLYDHKHKSIVGSNLEARKEAIRRRRIELGIDPDNIE